MVEKIPPTDEVRVKFGGVSNEVTNPDYEAWFQTDQLVKSWLFGTLSESVLGLFYVLRSAQDVWLMLAENFNKCSILRKFDLLASLQVLTKGNRDLSEYLKDFKNLCDSLNSIGKPVSEPMKIFRLLQGLRREYESFATVMQVSMNKPPVLTYTDVVSQLQGFDNRIKSYAPVSPAVSPHIAFQVQQANGSGGSGSNQNNYNT